MQRDKLVMPVVKWVGGKRQLLPALTPLLPKHFTTYCEPFLGGGAMLFWLQPKIAIVNDINSDLIQMYEVIRDHVEELILELSKHKNESKHFYEVRDWDRDKKKYNALSGIEKAARLIYLNKTCYNGLFRVNNAGEFNTPFGNYKNPNIVNAPTLRAVSNYLQKAKITFSCRDYADVLAEIPCGTFVYLDPPYDPASNTANFTGYSRGGFSREDQIRLKECCDDLTRRNIKFMLSNSATDFIKNLYTGYNITIVQAKRAINSNASKRGQVDEVVVRNYE
ncbi:MAG: Site-specific DNA-methyltransferase (adenine-specific) [Thermocaproicibacter melissae]|jgi:DNA adenine methylase|uniref:DNA adenine methylase n=1 Tax=Thermocaproicibacter melissae TaxID=2966552 RepID=UPI003A101348